MGKQKKPADTDWILAYYQKICNGSVIVGKWIRDWYTMVVVGLQEKRFFFDQKAANKVITFCEEFCRHHEGALAPGLITLETWQKAFISVIYGVKDANGDRQFREVVLQIGRKNGKTLLAACLSAYEMFMSEEYGARLYFVAPKLDQSRLCFNAFSQMIMKEPELSDLAKKRRTDIYVASSNSSAQPLAFSYQKSDGLNPSLTVCDEIMGPCSVNCTTCTLTEEGVVCQFDSRGPTNATEDNYPRVIDAALRGAGFTVEKSQMDNAHYVSPDTEVVMAMKEIWQLVHGTPATCTFNFAGSYAHFVDGAIAIGRATPGVETNIHKANECLPLKDLERLVELLALSILRFCPEK